MLGQRIAAKQQVLHVAKVTASFSQAIQRSGRAQIRLGGVRAELCQYRLQRVAIGTRQLTTAWRKTTGRFHETGCRINGCIRRGFRTQLLGQRVAAQQQVLHVAKVATSFSQTIDRRGRAQICFGGVRAELCQYRFQRIAIGTRQLTTAWRKTTGRFHETGSRINRSIRRRLRAQLLGQRVGAQQQVLYVLEVATGFRQAVYRGGRADFVFSGFRAELFQHRR